MADDKETGLQRLAKAMADEKWIEHCRNARSTFSAATTYLAQFMAHDMTLSAVDALNFSANAKPARKTQNFRVAPLRLETLYGEGLRKSQNLFSAHGMQSRDPKIKFALNKFKVLSTTPAKTVWGPKFAISMDNLYRTHEGARPKYLKATPSLGDARNSDQPMLLFISVAFMRLHNFYVSKISNGTANERFEAARILVTNAWHNVIRSDILDPLNPYQRAELPKYSGGEEDPDPIHGVMRALHALPLSEYHLHNRAVGVSKTQTLQFLLKNRAVTIDHMYPVEFEDLTSNLRGWWDEWGIDYLDFLDHPKNRTNVMPVLSTALEGERLFEKDLDAIDKHSVSPPSKYGSLLNGAEKVYEDLARVTNKSDFPPPDTLPLSVAILIEAYNSGDGTGGLGPIGYAVLSKRIESALSKAELQPDLSPLANEISALLKIGPVSFREVLNLLNNQPEELYV